MNKRGDFIIRVYGIVVNSKNEVLITDEFHLGMKMTKFPGGGLHFGEGLLDCLKREFKEECNDQEIKILKHFYTTDYFQKALFYKNHQLISIYYLVDLVPPLKFRISEKPFDFEEIKDGNQSFRWKNIIEMDENEFTFPIDRLVVKILKEKLRSNKS